MDLQTELYAHQDLAYREFIAKLIPNIPSERFIGVRKPVLNRLARRRYRESPAETEAFLSRLPHTFYEEDLFHTAVLAQMREFPRVLHELERFLPYIDNWSVCDTPRPPVLRRYPTEVEARVYRWLASGREYIVRYAIITLRENYLTEHFRPEHLSAVQTVSGPYYVNMARAWYFQAAFVKQPDAVLPLLEAQTLDPWTQNKAIQKMIESRQIEPAMKNYLRTLKIK